VSGSRGEPAVVEDERLLKALNQMEIRQLQRINLPLESCFAGAATGILMLDF
jgi:hypothetical protein